MKRILLSILFVFTGLLGSFAQPKGMGKNDPEAKKVLDAVSAKFKTYKTVQAKFSLKIENTAGKNLGTKTGTLYMKGTKYHISITGQEIFCDGVNVSTYDKGTNEVTITKLEASNSTITPQKLFTNFYSTDFLSLLSGEKKQGAKTIQEIELTPIDKTKPFFKVVLYVDKSTQTISSTKIFEKAGSRTTLSVTGMTTNTPIGEDQFVFDIKKYPGTEVVDLR